MARGLLTHRDTRWDGHEAIIIFREPPVWSQEHLADQLGYLWLGELSLFEDEFARAGTPHEEGTRQITVASADAKAWLPATATTSQARSPSEQRFYLDEPGPSTVGTRSAPSTTTADAPSITLENLKATIVNIEAKLAEGGTQEYRDCIKELYRAERAHLASGKFHKEVTVASGLPRGTIVVPKLVIPELGAELPPTAGPPGSHEFWVEGPDSHLFESVYPSSQTRMKRPLPTGEYVVFTHGRSPDLLPCDGRIRAQDDQYKITTTVTAPVGTLAEAFFDPVTSNAAFVGTTTTGAISWEDDTVTADLTLEVPANATLDFIALDGSVFLSLAVADATSADGVLAWEVTPQPWTAGDQLMLRIHQPPPLFSSATYNFELSEDAEVGHAVGRVVAIAHDRGAVTFEVTAGNDSSDLALGTNGSLTTTTFMDHETAGAYALTIEATGSNGGVASVTVAVTVTDVDPEYPPPPLAMAVVEVPDGFEMTWKAVRGVEEYAAQWKVVGGLYEDVFTTEASAEVRPDGGVQCGTEYKFRVYSLGDGTSYEAEWTRSVPEPVFVTTTACP